jgi:hypothetical protein
MSGVEHNKSSAKQDLDPRVKPACRQAGPRMTSFYFLDKHKKEADMVVRKYRESGSSKVVAGIIASEVIESGKSIGWQGSLEEFSQVEKILSDFNIFYVNDFVGEWGHKRVQLEARKFGRLKVRKSKPLM